VPLVASDGVELLKENEKHTIVIKKVAKAEEGTINVMATNEAGQMSSSARLKVTGNYSSSSSSFISLNTNSCNKRWLCQTNNSKKACSEGQNHQ